MANYQDLIPETNTGTSLREYVLKGKDYAGEVLRYWFVPAFFSVLLGAYFLYQYFQHAPEYPANITFMVDEDEGNSSAGLTGMLSQFGLGGVRPVRYNLDKILELSRSRRVVQKSLFTKTVLDGKDDFIINHIIRIYELAPVGEPYVKETEQFFFTHDSIPIFNAAENAALARIYGFVVGSPDNPKEALVTADYSDDTNIMTLTSSTINEELSIVLATNLFESLSSYYVNKSIEKSLKTYKIVSHKRDSILGELRAAEYQLAQFKDTHRGMLMRVDQLTELRLQREVTALSAMYAETLKNTEVADFSLKNKTPFVQVIDYPASPIQPTTVSLLRKLGIGLIIGGFIGCALIIGRRLYREIMNPPATA